MEKEKNYLIELCRAYFTGEAAHLSENINYPLLYKLSNAHNLSAVLFCVINNADNKSIIGKEAFSQFENDFYEAVIRYDIQQKILEELSGILEKEQIKHVFFKGAVIKEHYPVPQARVMGDIDVLIEKEERDRVKSLLTENGFVCDASNGPVYNYSKENVKIEVHTRILSGKGEEAFLDAIDHAEFKSFRGTLDNSYHFAYLIAHIAHHFSFYGAGIKLILDLAVMKSLANENDVLEIMKKAGFEEFYKAILSVCDKWFFLEGEGNKKAEDFLLSYGAFGNLNRNKAAVVERRQLEEGKKGFYKLRLLFPSYEKMKNIPYISFIEGRPFLVPLAWIYRLFYNLKYRRAFLFETTRNLGSDESKNDAQNELEFFKEIGLL